MPGPSASIAPGSRPCSANRRMSATRSGSRTVTAPPSPAATCLVAPMLTTSASPSDPGGEVAVAGPDGVRGIGDQREAVPIGQVRAMRIGASDPARCTGRIAPVRGVIAASTAAGSSRPSASTSATTGTMPAQTTACHVAKNVKPGMITSQPGSARTDKGRDQAVGRIRDRDDVADHRATATSASSRRRTYGPSLNRPDSTIARASSRNPSTSGTAGRWNAIGRSGAVDDRARERRVRSTFTAATS